MSKALEVRDRITAVVTSVVTVAVVVSQVGAIIVEQLSGWDGEWVNLVGVVAGIVFAIRRVTPVAKDERGLV
jgi:hypothetical protein